MSEVQGPLKGEDYYYYGVIFRSTDKVGFYLFEVTAANGGEFVFYRADNKDGNPVYRPIVDGIAPSLLPNPGQNNVLTIDAKGNSFTFLINGKPVLINGKPAVRPILDATQPALTSGAIGLFVDDPGAEVAFSQMQLNRLK